VAELALAGCRPRPLVGYLKALGLLRVLARQADPDALGRWEAGIFRLFSRLDAVQLHAFLHERYAPSPVISPWNGGSGFFPKDRREPLEAIERSRSERLAPYREAIKISREILKRRGLAEKPAQAEKPGLLRELRRELPDRALEWVDTAIALTGSAVGYPPLLGSGGNDGRFDFSNNYAVAVATCVADEAARARERSAELLTAALGGTPASLDKLSLAYLQRDGSPNNSPTGESEGLGNPWDLILGVEGTLVLCAGAARRHGWGLEPRLVAPFTADHVAAGYGSAANGERAYAELWLPLWPQGATLAEVEMLAREARAQVGRRWARDGLDFVRAAAELGVARGIEAFERYAILERAGQARLAVPAGRVEVRERPAVRALRSLDAWLPGARRFAGGDRGPRGVRTVMSALEQAMFAFAAEPERARAQAVLIELGKLESALARSARRANEAGLRPLRQVAASPWLEAADDGSPEFSIAVALASLRAGSSGAADLRDYLHGTRVDSRGRRAFDPDFRAPVARAGSPVVRLAAILSRRQLEAAAEGNGASCGFRHGEPVDHASLCAFALGVLDDRRILALASGLSVLDFHGARVTLRARIQRAPCPALDALALAWHGDRELGLGARPGWGARLAAHRSETVLREALLRLRLAGWRPLATAAELAASAPPGPRLAAALLVRPTRWQLAQMARSLDPRAELQVHSEEQANEEEQA
jgi:CRISPR-associated protein Csx17